MGQGRERNGIFWGNLVVPNVYQMIPSILTKCPMIIYYVFNLFLEAPNKFSIAAHFFLYVLAKVLLL